MKKKKLLIGLISLGVLATTGCGKIPKLENGEEVIASLDGKNFTANDLYNELKKQGGSSVLVNMIDTFIANQEITDSKEAEEYATSLIKQYKLSYEQNGADFEAALISNGYANEEEFKNVIAIDYKKSEIAKKYIKEEITEDELKDYYDNHISDELSVKHILIAPEVSDNATDEEKTNAENAALEKAKNLIEQLNNGADFETLAKENSADDATKDNGGVINNVVKEGYVTEFWNAAYALEDGKYTTEPVKTTYGYHVIHRIDQKEKAALEDIKDEVIEKISDEKKSADQNLYYKSLIHMREENGLKFSDTVFEDKYNAYIKQYK